MEKKDYFAPYELQIDEKERKIMLGEMLQALRKKNNMTQKEIAELLEINQASYAQYERGENAPSIEKLVRLSFFLIVLLICSYKEMFFIMEKIPCLKSLKNGKKI